MRFLWPVRTPSKPVLRLDASDKRFGEKLIIIDEDFLQSLLIVKRGRRNEAVEA